MNINLLSFLFLSFALLSMLYCIFKAHIYIIKLEDRVDDLESKIDHVLPELSRKPYFEE